MLALVLALMLASLMKTRLNKLLLVCGSSRMDTCILTILWIYITLQFKIFVNTYKGLLHQIVLSTIIVQHNIDKH